ncbi:hypothetical protein [Desulfopila aestuarii]|uniref:HAMP domain-containing protein n=1 Tax=Desulfopila aestuarii DSM 18488 TaxID=1121416 RepID=A0A1M7Y052_9BACT|nr:hypothetical protein [Desulfopila aestuarii]SHO44670.1 hypothetical protein SAMN02745220_00834 [Desulfopila aestuarii DSM 18488]
MYSLRKLVWAAYGVVGCLLAFIILLGVRQYVLSDQYNSIISQSEKAIFHFATIREAITESLIDERWQRLESVIPEIEKLNSELVRLQESTLIPSEFKLALVDKIDLAGIIITVRRLMHGEGDIRQSKSLQEQMRAIADHLLQYDRIIGSQARGRILNFQMVIIGALGLIISLASFSLNKLYKNTVVPLLKVATQLQTAGKLAEDVDYGPDVSREIYEVIEGVKSLSSGSNTIQREDGNGGLEQALLAETVNETANRLNGIINYAQLLADDESSTLTEQERQLLQKIIDSGNSIAVTWKKVL